MVGYNASMAASPQGVDLAVEQLVKLSPGLASYRVPMFDLCGVRRGLQGIRHVNVLAREFSALIGTCRIGEH